MTESLGICSLNFFELSQRVIFLFPHIVQITQGIGQIADCPVPFSPQVITQSPGKGQERSGIISGRKIPNVPSSSKSKPIHILTLCSPSLPQFCPSLERPSPFDIWPPQPPVWPPSVPGTWPHIVSSASQSLYWLVPCRGWPCLVSKNVEQTRMSVLFIAFAFVTTSYKFQHPR